MQQFMAGFVVALLVVVIGVVLLSVRKRRVRNKPQQDKVPATDKEKSTNNHLKQLEELSKLAGGLAHEIKNPLSTIKINLKLISEDLKGSELDKSTKISPEKSNHRLTRALRKIAIIQKEADRLEQILDGFLRYINIGKLQLASVDINSLISDMVDFYLPQAHSYSITMRQGLYKEPLICRVDADMLKQVMLNLFINAQRAMRDGGELMVRTNKQERQAIIQVSDTGSGISADKLPYIFDASHSFRPQGSGFGLPITKKIIEAHNGSITVNSEPGKGTSFTIKLPLAQ